MHCISNSNRWTWDEEKTDAFSVELKNYRSQKLDEGVEWNSDKIAQLESVRTLVNNKLTTLERAISIGHLRVLNKYDFKRKHT